MQTTPYRMGKQQGSTVYHRELYSISCHNHNGKEKITSHLCLLEYNSIEQKTVGAGTSSSEIIQKQKLFEKCSH